MSYRCSECDVNFWPFQTRDGACPRCGGGTRRVVEDGNSGLVRLRDAESRQPTEPIDILEIWYGLPAVEPTRELRFGRKRAS